MTDRFVCPACRGKLDMAMDSGENPGAPQFICANCGETYPLRDDTPVLIYPKPDMHQLEIMYSGGSKERRRSLFRRAADLFLYQARSSGWISAIWMLPTFIWVKLSNKSLIALSRLPGTDRVECSCCGWMGLKFGTFWGTNESIPDFACPACGSHPRHRFLAKYLPHFIDMNSENILHFAPEEFLEPIFNGKNKTDRRITTDITLSGVSCLSNINHLPFDDNSFDNIICIHVLEHIEDDRGAMRELYRVLGVDGTAVICIPEIDKDTTIEFGFEDPTKSHHWRDYGRDVTDRLSDAGFMVKTVTPGGLEEDFRRYGLAEHERFHLCRKQ